MTTLSKYLLVQLEEPNAVPNLERSGSMKDILFRVDLDKISVRDFKRLVIINIIFHIIFMLSGPTNIFCLFYI